MRLYKATVDTLCTEDTLNKLEQQKNRRANKKRTRHGEVPEVWVDRIQTATVAMSATPMLGTTVAEYVDGLWTFFQHTTTLKTYAAAAHSVTDGSWSSSDVKQGSARWSLPLRQTKTRCT